MPQHVSKSWSVYFLLIPYMWDPLQSNALPNHNMHGLSIHSESFIPSTAVTSARSLFSRSSSPWGSASIALWMLFCTLLLLLFLWPSNRAFTLTTSNLFAKISFFIAAAAFHCVCQWFSSACFPWYLHVVVGLTFGEPVLRAVAKAALALREVSVSIVSILESKVPVTRIALVRIYTTLSQISLRDKWEAWAKR